MVIVILGILAATALPKFANLKGNANYSKLAATLGAMRSAASIVHSQSVIDGVENDVAASISLEGSNLAVSKGYPTVESILIAAGDIDLTTFDNSTIIPRQLLFVSIGTCIVAYLPPGSPLQINGISATAVAPLFIDVTGDANKSC